jgi:hypothetical protein
MNDSRKKPSGEAECRAALESNRRALGEDHPDTLASRHALARMLREIGRLEEAQALEG